MEFKDIIKRAQEVQKKYRVFNRKEGRKIWSVSEYAQGFVGDLGDLMKLIMTKENFLHGRDVDRKLKRELSDCLWSIIILAKELEVDLEKEFLKTMSKIEKRIK